MTPISNDSALWSTVRHAAGILSSRRNMQQAVRACVRFPMRYLAAQAVDLAPAMTLGELFPGISCYPPMGRLDRYEYNVRLDEQIYLGFAVQAIGAKRIFEIGTFDGETTRYLAEAAGSEAHVWTIDLPPEAFTEAGLQGWFTAEDVGRAYRGTPEAERITQLRGDSTSYDYRSYWNTMDVVFVDAAHDFSHGLADSRTALRLVRPGGCVLWHDYSPQWGRLVLAVNEATRGRGLCRIAGTSLALLRIPR